MKKIGIGFFSSIILLSYNSNIYAETIGDAFVNGDTSGKVRIAFAGYDYDIDEYNRAEDIGVFSIGGDLHYESADYNGFKGGVTFFTTQGLDLNDKPKSDVDGYSTYGFFDANRKSYTLLQEVYFELNIADTSIKLGRQKLNDIPFLGPDDIRMASNSFEAIKLVNRTLPNTTLYGLYITKMSGPDNWIDQKKFTGILEGRGEFEGRGDGMPVFGAVFDGFHPLRISLWNYYLTNIANQFYADATLDIPLGYSANMFLGSQYMQQTSVGDELGGEIDAYHYGFKGAFTFHPSGTTLTGAYLASGDEATKYYWVANEFTNYFDWNVGIGRGPNTEVIAGGIEQDFSAVGISGLSLAGYYGSFVADNYDTDEGNIVVSWEVYDFYLNFVASLIKNNFYNEKNNIKNDSRNVYIMRADYNF